MLTTFVACGFFLHDLPAWVFTRRMLPPGATIVRFLFGSGAVLVNGRTWTSPNDRWRCGLRSTAPIWPARSLSCY